MLEVQDMHLSFARYCSLLRREWLPVLNGVSCSVQRGELVALVIEIGRASCRERV